MERRRGPKTTRLVTVALLFCALAIPLFAVAGCGKQLARMEKNQVKLQAMIAANARELATVSSQLHTGQGKINESIQTLDHEEALEQLYQLRRVGRWSAEYVLLRGMGRTSLFPGDDVGAQNKLRHLLRLRKPPDYRGVRRLLDRWQPLGGLIYFHLLLDGLLEEGYL